MSLRSSMLALCSDTVALCTNMLVLCNNMLELRSNIFLFYLHQPHRPARRPKTGLSVIGDEPCRLNGTTQALGEPVEVNHLRRTIHRVPRGSHPPDRPGGLTLPLWPSASHHRQRIPARQLSEDYLVPDNLGQHPGPGLVTPYLNRRGAHSKHIPKMPSRRIRTAPDGYWAYSKLFFPEKNTLMFSEAPDV